MTSHTDLSRARQFVGRLYGTDPFAGLRARSERHRREHGPHCDAFPCGLATLRLVEILIEANNASHLLEIGTGLGYSAVHLASAMGPSGTVHSVERDSGHAALARHNIEEAGLGGRITVFTGDATAVLSELAGPYDLILEDAWFAARPPYFVGLLRLLRPGGMLTMANWFALYEGLAGVPHPEWDLRYGSDWPQQLAAFASDLASDPALHAVFLTEPSVVLAARLPTR